MESKSSEDMAVLLWRAVTYSDWRKWSKEKFKPGVVVQACNPVLRSLRQEDHIGFEVSLGYMVSSKTAWIRVRPYLPAKKIEKVYAVLFGVLCKVPRVRSTVSGTILPAHSTLRVTFCCT